ncbi:ThuA domain-containing protein [Spirosoma utsteinense]|uniref:Type 1 glutamine amidotransferase n=1 Tax=Spirosoma utsteinense TaxID=2585773 RepID=A0ABR6WEA8_9BACT|nr:ThuA domain-containing protein [Spirosoma utsteinense]MBC3787454.1 type 1 glutamine amidotransferase [Spirosoma utsteinense]MBC3794883.1 type 1 glutamine amidotransferase [Spirosoma utsteinense]
MNRISTVLMAGVLLALLSAGSSWSQDVKWKKVRVLVYTRNGKGYVHDNIPNAVVCLQKLGRQHGFKVDVSDEPAVFSESNLKQYTLLIFPSTNNDVFDTDGQRLAFRRYIEAGGGFVGIHSVMGTERNWPWFKRMIGGTFAWHPPFQPIRINILDSSHPSVQGLPAVWEKEDEFYFTKDMSPGPTVIMAGDLTSLNQTDSAKVKTFQGSYTSLYPMVWHYNFDGGHTWCTTLGHAKSDYENPTFVRHIFQGIGFVASQVGRIDPRNAYAETRDSPIR